MTKLFYTTEGPVVEQDGRYRLLQGVAWDALFNASDLYGRLLSGIDAGKAVAAPGDVRAPLGTQEVWAAGVTYLRSKAARMTEAEAAGGGDFYDRVYAADRPELFFKATPHRVAGPGQAVRIRQDARWSVPEPELALAVNARGQVIGYTIGNDMSARDIEGENPLYLTQAKVYSAAALALPSASPPPHCRPRPPSNSPSCAARAWPSKAPPASP